MTLLPLTSCHAWGELYIYLYFMDGDYVYVIRHNSVNNVVIEDNVTCNMFHLTNFTVSHIQDIPEWYSCYSTEVLSCIETTTGVTHYTLLQ